MIFHELSLTKRGIKINLGTDTAMLAKMLGYAHNQLYNH